MADTELADTELADTDKGGEGFDVGSGCSLAGRPFVEIHWEDKGAQVSPENARELAASLLTAAASAEADAMLLTFFRRQGLPDGAWQMMVSEWRAGEGKKA